MKANVGSYDCGARFILGNLLLFLINHGLGWWGLLGIIFILSAATERCLLYALFRFDSAKREENYERRHGHSP